MYDLEILHQWGKRFKTESQKVLGAASSNVCRSDRGKTGRGVGFLSSPILNRIKENIIFVKLFETFFGSVLVSFTEFQCTFKAACYINNARILL